MRRFMAAGALSAVGAFLIVSLSLGQGQEKKKDEINRKMSKQAQTVEHIAAAYKMVDFGREHKVPEALIAAARVIGTAGSKKGDLEPKSKVKKPGELNEMKEATTLLDEAIKMANNAEPIKTLAEQARKEINRQPFGAVGGPRAWYGLFTGLDFDRRDTYYVTLYGGEFTNVSLRGFNATSGALDIDLEVFDDTGRLVGRDSSVGANGFVSVYVPYRATYRVDVINYIPRIACDYCLRTN